MHPSLDRKQNSNPARKGPSKDYSYNCHQQCERNQHRHATARPERLLVSVALSLPVPLLFVIGRWHVAGSRACWVKRIRPSRPGLQVLRRPRHHGPPARGTEKKKQKLLNWTESRGVAQTAGAWLLARWRGRVVCLSESWGWSGRDVQMWPWDD